MGLSNAGKAVGLNAIGGVGLFVSLHTADPGTTGASEAAGGSPAYARQGCVWGAASAGSMSLSAAELFDLPGSVTVSYFGVWSASSGGTFYGGGALSSPETSPAQWQYQLSNATISIT
ncbi:phage tail fiber protein [Actinomadura decatromicini]|uniref:Uncharacterized protein n=1 Tax=Actinomadura decatromicini TaxID=2604572 RepID=A0A5D3FH33_9ACTN|nr:hypothetical protein [Actinomadura decatromicini]TYK47150.1 hypothetical protein FXF68_25445 [Actinomadura decatromicini]